MGGEGQDFMKRDFIAVIAIWICVSGASIAYSSSALCLEFVGIVSPVGGCEADTDGDGLSDCEEDLDRDGVFDAEDGETDFQNADTDGDGLVDGDEGDRDGDGELGPDESDPTIADTDGDGILDGDEAREGTKRNTCDTDEDGLSDGVEVGAIQPDEVNGCHGLQPAGTNFHNPYGMDPLNPDSDADGLTDGEEDLNGNGWLDPDETDPSMVDTDRDGIEDGVEARGDFDGDGIPDFDFRMIQGEGECRPPEEISDLDCDGIPNARDDDSDNDGCADALEGSWIDANANGIPDIYDNEAKVCPEPASDSTGSTGSTAEESEDQTSASVDLPTRFADGPACSLCVAGASKGRVAAGFAFFLALALLFAGRYPTGRADRR